MDNETFSIVNIKDEHISVVFGKHNLHVGGRFHRAVHVFVEVFGGKFIIQKKAVGTENGGTWSSAASGHVRFNETYKSAAIRELEEEIGLKIGKERLRKIIKAPPSFANSNEFVTLFTCLIDPEKENLKLDSKEVDEIVIAKFIDIVEDVQKYRCEYSPAFVELFNVFLAMEKGIGE